MMNNNTEQSESPEMDEWLYKNWGRHSAYGEVPEVLRRLERERNEARRCAEHLANKKGDSCICRGDLPWNTCI